MITMTRALPVVATLCGMLSVATRDGRAESSSSSGALLAPEARPLTRLALPDVLEAPASLSADGRYVAFETRAGLVPADVNQNSDIYVLDRVTGKLSLESVSFDGGSANGTCRVPRLSGDGRWLVFESAATNLIRESAGQRVKLVLRDRTTGTMRGLTPPRPVNDASADSGGAAISADGRVVAFWSHDTQVVPGVDANGTGNDVYVITLETGRIVRASVTSNGVQPSAGGSFAPSLNADGTMVAFTSTADLEHGTSTLLPCAQVFVRDLAHGTTRLVSVAANGRDLGNQISHGPSISGDGRMVAFVSMASNLGSDDDNRLSDIYARDLQTGTTTLVSRTKRGKAANGHSSRPAISADGQFVAYVSDASDLARSKQWGGSVDDNLLPDVYVTDIRSGQSMRVSGAAAADQGWWTVSQAPAIDAHGTTIAFPSKEPIDPRDVEGDFDLYLWTRAALATSFLTRS